MKSALLYSAVISLLAMESQGFLQVSRPKSTRQTRLDSKLFRTLPVAPPVIAPMLQQPQSIDEQGNSLINNRHSSSDWLYNVRSIPQSGVLRDVRNPVLAVAGWSVAVSAIQRLLWHSKSSFLQTIATKLCIPGTAHGFLVSAIGLLLVFRTNSSYQRFCEGRRIWENILNVSRNLSRMIQLYSNEVGKKRERLLLNLIAAYPYLLRNHIRPGCLCDDAPMEIHPADRILMLEPSAAPVVTRYDGDKSLGATTARAQAECWVDKKKLPWALFSRPSLAKLSLSQNRPLWVCDRLGKEIMKIEYGPNFTSRERLTMLGMVSKLTDALGQCERIQQTAVPLNYARHSLRSLTLWLFTLPFALVKDMGMLTGPVIACVAWLLYGIYQIGYSIEDPFQGSLRLSILCDAIRSDVLGRNADQRESAYAAEDSSWEDEEDLGAHGDFRYGMSYGDFSSPVSSGAVNSLLRVTAAANSHSRPDHTGWVVSGARPESLF